MKFDSQICTTRDQSEQLLAFGLKAETADIVIRPDNTLIIVRENSFIYHNLENAVQEEYLLAWSLHRLIEMLPKEMSHQSKQWHLFLSLCYEDAISYEECNSLQPCYLHFCNLENIYDNIIEAIEWLIKNGCFNKEYLDE